MITIPHNFKVYFGPPGTGKTTTLTGLVKQYVKEEGADSLLLTSFTKAAAEVLAGKDLALGLGSIGTLHSHCYQALDHPTIAETKIKEWNAAFPRYPMTPGTSSMMQNGPDEQEARGGESLPCDALLHAYNLSRAALKPLVDCDPAVRSFAAKYEDWKGQSSYLDFTDLLVTGLQVLRIAPGNPRTIIVDEAQDLTPLQWAVVAQWSQHATRTIAAGDDDQALYQHVGANPAPLLAAPHKEVLPLSYRLPQAIYKYAQHYLKAIRTREPKTWTHNGLPGRYVPSNVFWKHPETFLPLIEAALDEPWGTFMVLAPCSYQLSATVAVLKQEGIPFENKWRRRRGDWNPLYYAGKGISSVARLLDFLRPPERLWTWRELASWAGILRTRDNLLPEASTLLTLHAEENVVCPLERLEHIFTSAALAGALKGSLDWLETRILKQYAGGMQFPLRVYKRCGRAGLSDDPRVYVGTCHSVKGGEADQVLLFTELSRAFAQARGNGGAGADGVERMLYVGATRAREVLYVV